MAYSKADQYEKELQLVNESMRSICYPARQRIIRKLRFDGPCTVKQLRKNHPISETTFSGHLRVLVKGKFIHWKMEYPYIYYTLDLERLREAKKVIYEFFESLDL